MITNCNAERIVAIWLCWALGAFIGVILAELLRARLKGRK